MERTSEVLNKAADLIEERGWLQGGSGHYDEDPWGKKGQSGPVCLEGGILAAIGGGVEVDPLYECPAYWAVADYLGRNPTPRKYPIQDAIWSWNDREGRTAAEVIEVLRACALIEAARDQDAAEATYAENLAAASA